MKELFVHKLLVPRQLAAKDNSARFESYFKTRHWQAAVARSAEVTFGASGKLRVNQCVAVI